jgi:hypothetical protein
MRDFSKIRFRDLAGAALTLTLLTAALPAAAEWKGYPGLNCMPASGANDVRRSLSGAANWQGSATTIYCPVVRDLEAGKPNGIERISVRLFDNHSTQNGWCRVVSRTLSGATHDWQHRVYGGFAVDRTVTFENVDTSNWGNIALYCQVPGADGARKSFIRSYAVEEQ